MPGVDFSRNARGEILKYGNGGVVKGPAMRPSDSSLAIFSRAMLMLAYREGEFLDGEGAGYATK